MLYMGFESKLWAKLRTALLTPTAATAAVSDVNGGVRIPFAELLTHVKEVQRLIEHYLQDGDDTGGARAERSPGVGEDPDCGPHAPSHRATSTADIPSSCELQPMASETCCGAASRCGSVGHVVDSGPLSVPLVAVFCHPSLDYLCMTLAVLAAGAAFLPLDPGWPVPRVAAVVRLARPALLLATPANQHLLPRDALRGVCRIRVVQPPATPPPAPALRGPPSPPRVTLVAASGKNESPLQPSSPPPHPTHEQLQQQWTQAGCAAGSQRTAPAATVATPARTAHRQDREAVRRLPLPYFAVLYTSGSTGEPVGVCMSEDAWLARIRWMQGRYPLRPPARCGSRDGSRSRSGSDEKPGALSDSGLGSVVCFSTAVSFVDHLWQLLAPLLAPGMGGPAAGGEDGLGSHAAEEGLAEEAGGDCVAEVRKDAACVYPGADPIGGGGRGGGGGSGGGGAGLLGGSGRSSSSDAVAESTGCAGPCSVVIPQPGAVLLPELFVGLLAEHGVTHVVSVPSLLRHLLPALRSARNSLGRLQLLVSSGEPLAVDLARELTEALPPGARLLNLYGCTELTADCTWFEEGARWGGAAASGAPAVATATAGDAPGRLDVAREIGAGEDMAAEEEERQKPHRHRHREGLGTVRAGGLAVPQQVAFGEGAPRTIIGPAPAAADVAADAGADVEAAEAEEEADAALVWVPAGWPIGDTQIFIAPLPYDHETSADGNADEDDGSADGHADGDGRDRRGATSEAFDAVIAPPAGQPLGAASALGSRDAEVGSGPHEGVRRETRVQPLPHGSVGEVWVAGSCLSPGYYLPPPTAVAAAAAAAPGASRFVRVRLTAEQSRHVMTAGGVGGCAPRLEAVYFRTGDLGCLRPPTGCLHVFGRVDRQVKVGGVRLDLGELEALLSAHPDVREAAVVTATAATASAQLSSSEARWRWKMQRGLGDADATPQGLPSKPTATRPLELVAYVCLDAPGGAQAAAVAAVAPRAASGDPYSQADGTLLSVAATAAAAATAKEVPEPVAAALRSWLLGHLPVRGGLKLRFLCLPYLPRNPAGKLMRRQLPPAPVPSPPLPPPPSPASQTTLEPLQQQKERHHHNHQPQQREPQLELLHHHQVGPERVRQPISQRMPTASVPPLSEVAVMRAIVVATGLTALEATTDIFAVGATSLDAVQIAGMLGADVRLVMTYPSARALAAALRAAASGASGVEDVSDGGGRGRGAGSFSELVQPVTAQEQRQQQHGDGWKRGLHDEGSSGIGGGDAGGSGPLGPPAKRPRTGGPLPMLLSAPLVPSAAPRPVAGAGGAKKEGAADAYAGADGGGGEDHADFGGSEAEPAGGRQAQLRSVLSACRQVTWRRGGGGGGTEAACGGDDGDVGFKPGTEGDCGGDGTETAAGGGSDEDIGDDMRQGDDDGTVLPGQVGRGAAAGRFRGRWRYRLGRCVDAPVLLVNIYLDSGSVPELNPQVEAGSSGLRAGCGDSATQIRHDQEQPQTQAPNQPRPQPQVEDTLSAAVTVAAPAAAPADAVLETQPGAAGDAAAPPAHYSRGGCRRQLSVLLACSHDGDVACLDADTGLPYWHVQLPSRAEAGMAVAWGPLDVDHTRDDCMGNIRDPDSDRYHSKAEEDDADYAVATASRIRTAAAVATGKGIRLPHRLPPEASSAAVAEGCAAVRQVHDTCSAAGLGSQQVHLVPYVVVACGDGLLYCLDLADGAAWGAVDCGGEFKSPPVCDPWVGAVWAAGHGRQLTAMRPPNEVLARLPLGAPVSTPVTFAALLPPSRSGPSGPAAAAPNTLPGAYAPTDMAPSITLPEAAVVPPNIATVPAAGCSLSQRQRPVPQVLRLALVAALDGSVTGVRVDLGSRCIGGGSGGGGDGHGGGCSWPPVQMSLSQLWVLRGPSPVFSAPLALPELGGTGEAAVDVRQAAGEAVKAVVGHVDGTVLALRLEVTGSDPRVIWTARLQGNLFADLAYLPPQPGPKSSCGCSDLISSSSPATPAVASAAAEARIRGGGAEAGAIAGLQAPPPRPPPPPPRPQTRPLTEGLIIAATHAGLLYGLDAAYGTQIWRVDLACGPISAAPAPAWLFSPLAPTLGKGPGPRGTSSGLPPGAGSVSRQPQASGGPCSALVAVCASSGALVVVCLDLDVGVGPGTCGDCGAPGSASGGVELSAEEGEVHLEVAVEAAARLPGEVFSSPLVLPQLTRRRRLRSGLSIPAVTAAATVATARASAAAPPSTDQTNATRGSGPGPGPAPPALARAGSLFGDNDEVDAGTFVRAVAEVGSAADGRYSRPHADARVTGSHERAAPPEGRSHGHSRLPGSRPERPLEVRGDAEGGAEASGGCDVGAGAAGVKGLGLAAGAEAPSWVLYTGCRDDCVYAVDIDYLADVAPGGGSN